MLEQTRVIPFLLENECIAASSIVDGRVSVVDSSRRNRNFKVISDQGPCFLLKQGVDENSRATVAHESVVYRFLQSLKGEHDLARYIPRFHRYDQADQVLVLELLDDAEDMRDFHTRRRSFPIGIAVQLGLALSALHRATRLQPARTELGGFSGRQPWALWVHRPGLEIFRDTSGANLQLLRIIQNTAGFPELLDKTREGWRFDSFIHHDIKWDNCILYSPTRARRKSSIKIIDWEFADLGDACWDAGAVFSASKLLAVLHPRYR